MWESILPTQTAITQQEKISWSNINIGMHAKSFVVTNTDFTWTVHSPQHGYSEAYPKIDHTLNQATGSYLLLRAEPPRKVGDRAVLMSDRYDIDPNNRMFCLKFFYFMKNMAQYDINSKIEIFQSENFMLIQKVFQLSVIFNPNPNWTPFNITVKPENISSTNMWFYLVYTRKKFKCNNFSTFIIFQ
jgi:hypothetical protein